MLFYPMELFLEWVKKNPWFYLVLIGLGVFFGIISEFVSRKKMLKKLLNSNYYEEIGDALIKRYYVTQRRKDIVMFVFCLILTVFFVYIYLYIKKNNYFASQQESFISNFILGYLIFSILFAIIKKDLVIKFIFKIPTFMIFAVISSYLNATSTKYEGSIDTYGRVTIEKSGGGITAFLGLIIGIPLFFIKITIILLYLLVLIISNIIYILITYPIFILNSCNKIRTLN